MESITHTQSDKFIAELLGRRLRSVRLERNESQEQLAVALGVSIPTYIAAEAGQMKMSLLIATLRHFNLLENLNLLFPEEEFSPIEQAKLQGKTRKRASQRDRSERAAPVSYPRSLIGSTMNVAEGRGGVKSRYSSLTPKLDSSPTSESADKEREEW